MTDDPDETTRPRFELIGIAVDKDVPPPLARLLADNGVPRTLIGGRYRAMRAATVLPEDPTGNLIWFGSSGLQQRICLDATTGAVVDVVSPRTLQTTPVNATLPLFTQCARALYDHFPFYDDDSEPEAWELAARDVAAALAAIDPVTASHNGFWESLVSDIAIGDYATENILDQ